MNEDFRIKLNIYREKFKSYLEACSFADRTADSYIRNLAVFFAFLEDKGVSSINEVSRETITEFQSFLFSKIKKDGKRITPQTRNLYLIALRRFFRFLSHIGEVYSDLSYDIELAREYDTLPRNIPTEKEAIRILNMPDTDEILGLRDKAILEILYSTGIRNTEFRNLTMDDVDFENREMRVMGKGRKVRIVPIGKIALGYLEEYVNRERPRLINKKDEKLLFVTVNGKLFDVGSLSHIVVKYALKAGVKKHITPHSFRHALATHLLKNGVNIRYIQEMLGHKCLESTQIYTRVEISDLKRVHSETHPRERGIV